MNPQSNKTTDNKIIIVGGGLKGGLQLTQEGCDAIRLANSVFLSRSTFGLCEVVKELNPYALVNDIDILGFRIADYRPDMYSRMAERIVNEATRRSPVTLIEPGSAVLTDLVTRYVAEFALQDGIEVCIVPGISSVEAMLSHFRLDASNGLQIIQARTLLCSDLTLNSSMSLIVIQPGYYDTLFWIGFPESKSQRLIRLQRKLLETYPKNSPVAVFRISPFEPYQTSVFWSYLKNFNKLYNLVSPLHTLFIPRVSSARINTNFVQRTQSWIYTLHKIRLSPNGYPKQKPSEFWIVEDTRELSKELIEESQELERQWQCSQIWRDNFFIE